ncbi:MAG: hypothetical protein A2754_01310 [Candidatus Magasanikbacteria bacterium RIFCSPHIGHO2_01_FULL_47_8]|uniref:Uncharacterized protein n=1 Tax=Candidatus Magasanikbacteria bacterium RIFCSPHIGHO2_01_FULL_47_8 TaxID=1798673 RepID=A0A1F6MDF5_9BACT|nr:MAG: hypothetical protein A2754_01310 [Candidatus Magasanikbacteria bacterium RIFCSPHIGHO2_01_FULL_47_8]
MTPEEQKTIDRLIVSINKASSRPWRVFFMGILSGIGSGIGATIGLSILVAAAFYFFKLSGLEQAFHNTLQTMKELAGTLKSIR